VYSIADAAQEIGCSEETLRNWDRDGKLPALRDRNNERRYRPEDIERGKKILQKRPSRI
jgi:DNA (cytosine-5)-methyltransferase 1